MRFLAFCFLLACGDTSDTDHTAAIPPRCHIADLLQFEVIEDDCGLNAPDDIEPDGTPIGGVNCRRERLRKLINGCAYAVAVSCRAAPRVSTGLAFDGGGWSWDVDAFIDGLVDLDGGECRVVYKLS